VIERSLRIVALLATLASCRVDSNYGGAGFACSDSEPCQSGFNCSQGICEAETAEADARNTDGPDANDSDATEIECLAVIALSDQFEGDILDPQWTALLENGTGATVGAGALTITPRMDSVPARFARVQSVPFAFDEKRVFAEIPMMVDASTLAVGEFQLASQPLNHYFLRQSQGVLQFGTTIGGTELIVAASAYEPTSHRWWQMRVTGGRVYADLSANGSTWVNLDSVAADVIVGDLYLELSAGTTASVAAPGLMQVDNVNSGSGLCL
jgi:hypothetical protein